MGALIELVQNKREKEMFAREHALVGALMELVQNKREKDMFAREHAS